MKATVVSNPNRARSRKAVLTVVSACLTAEQLRAMTSTEIYRELGFTGRGDEDSQDTNEIFDAAILATRREAA